ncbi:hypothetical protein [Pseudoruegeria sp. HB172150]|uniref:hypothetical protein n=1 Tax=Pseudoruegeria sp. HB172150 TaxID=2721164 RepID=UPI0015556D4C|nr:hypothetical protein [Pseudoruegeria sp. HB172150]
MFKKLISAALVAATLMPALAAPSMAERGIGGLSADTGGGGGGGHGGGHGGGKDYTENDDRDSNGLDHDSDAQLDVWVQRCNDAGGGMSTGSDGNYDCTGADGQPIDDY